MQRRATRTSHSYIHLYMCPNLLYIYMYTYHACMHGWCIYALYEKARPDVLRGPGGWLDLRPSEYEQLGDGRTCRVRGGVYTFPRDEGDMYEVKMEGGLYGVCRGS